MSHPYTSYSLLSPTKSHLFNLPTPVNLSFMWNFGSLLSMCLVLQILTGLLLTMHYSPDINSAFSSINHITRDVNFGWILRNTHANGASMFFLAMYLHIARGFIYSSFKYSHVWTVGVTIYIVTMATAFMGYLLPWGQMSFWGATVITNLFSAIPYAGQQIVMWIWGGFGVGSATLSRFYSLHFILPFLIAALSLMHITLLHMTGSSTPMGVATNIMKVAFHILFSVKDILGILIFMLILSYISFFKPNMLTDPENFITANSLITPTHIKPEWYFLWAYAILRSIPNKLGGVLMMFSAIAILYLCPLNKLSQSTKSTPIMYLTMMILFTSWTMLTFVGGEPVEDPYISLGLSSTLMYFSMMATIIAYPNQS